DKETHYKNKDVSSPAPVDCQLSQWSEWTDCFPCHGRKVRLHSNTQLSDDGCCLRSTLDIRMDTCGTKTGVKDNFLNAVSFKRYNILTQEEKRHIYDPKFLGSHCESVYNGEWRALRYDAMCERLYYGDDEKYFLKPYNFHVYQFLAHADSGFSSEFYDDSKDLIDALKSSKSKGGGFTFGIGPKKIDFKLNLGFTLSRGKGSLKNFTEYTAKNVGFIRIATKVQTARFKMRRNNVVLDEDMLISLQELPDTYNYGMYAKFINDYGTHFMTSGTMGGDLEFILVVNKEEMRRKDISYEEVTTCFGLSLGISATKLIGAVSGVDVVTNICVLVDFTAAGSNSPVVEDIIVRIKGGDTSYSARPLSSWDSNTYRHWGRSLKYNPAIIDFELQPIHEILRRSDAGNMETKRQHLKQALDEYLLEFNACRCGPCQNNGEPILVGDECSCQCRSGYSGPACEQSTEVDGRWSCWSSWTPCQSGSRHRRRQCTNPAPQHGGAPCMGRDVQSSSC
uniref:Complement C8 alpha chain n=1 Tax=Pavo cristatus TaxID=9049 RepID=A0A8C9ETS2_PAVCR